MTGMTVYGDMTLSVVDADEPLDQLIKGDEKKIIFYQKALTTGKYTLESGPASAADVFDKPCIQTKQPFLHIEVSREEIAAVREKKIIVLNDNWGTVRIKRLDGGEEKGKEKEKETKETKQTYEEMGDSLDKEEAQKYLTFKDSKLFYFYNEFHGYIRCSDSI